VRLIDRVVESQAGGDLLIGRHSEARRSPRADQYGYVPDGNVKAIQQFLYISIEVEVDVCRTGVRLRVRNSLIRRVSV